MNKIGMAAIIIAVTAAVGTIATAVMNLITFKWAVKVYKPFGRLVEKAELWYIMMIEKANKDLDE